MCFATLALAGTAISAAGTVFGGIATSNAASYQAQVAENNAKIAQQNATYSLQAGEAKQQQEGLKAAEEGGAVKTALAANNTDVNSGSALDVESGAREKGTLSQYTIENNASLQAYGYRSQAVGFQAEAGLDEAKAAEAPIGAGLAAGGSLLSNASSIGWKWGGGGGSASPNPWAVGGLDTATAPG